jgi:hypothetical protein
MTQTYVLPACRVMVTIARAVTPITALTAALLLKVHAGF